MAYILSDAYDPFPDPIDDPTRQIPVTMILLSESDIQQNFRYLAEPRYRFYFDPIPNHALAQDILDNPGDYYWLVDDGAFYHVGDVDSVTPVDVGNWLNLRGYALAMCTELLQGTVLDVNQLSIWASYVTIMLRRDNRIPMDYTYYPDSADPTIW